MRNRETMLLLVVTGAILLAAPDPLLAHCDRLDGPVGTSARAAIAANDFRLIQVWVGPDQEAELRNVFDRVLEVRKGASPPASWAIPI